MAKKTNPEQETAVLSVAQHRTGCPAERIEAYTATKPGGEAVQIVRCIDCGAADVHSDADSETEVETEIV